jgi:flagellar motor switch protein FliN
MNKSNPAASASAHFQWLMQVRGRIQATLGAMLERSVSLVPESPKKLTPGDFDSLLPDGPVAISIPFGAVGGWHLLLPRALATLLADLASMGDGKAEWNEDIHPGTLREIWLQVATDLEPDVVQLLGDSAQLGDIQVASVADDVIAGWGGEPAIIWSVDISDWGTSQFVMLVENSFVHAFAGGEEEPDPEPAAEPEPVAPQPEPVAKAKAHETVARPAAFQDFEPRAVKAAASTPRNIDTLLDISLPITIELGRTRMLVRDVLDLGPGSVIELDKMSGEPVDLFVNDKKFAKGEVVVIEENFGVRITELLKVDERLKALK